MQVGSVAFSLSPEAQRAAEQKLVSQAIDSFRKQAQSAAQGFGYSNFTIREVNVGRGGIQPRPVMMMQSRAMSAARSNWTAMTDWPATGQSSTVRQPG